MSWVRIIYYGLLGICLAVLLLKAKRLNKVYYWFVPLIISAIGVQVSREVLKHINFSGYDFVFHIYQPVEYSLLALFYYNIIHARLTKKIILVSIPVVVLFSVFYYTVGGGDFFGGDFLDFVVCSFFLCIWTIIFLWNSYGQTKILISLPILRFG